MAKVISNVPPYGYRKGWIPRTVDEFGDGGAFPEIHVPQYPLDMGLVEITSNALVVPNDADEDSKTEMLLRQGHDKERIILSKPSDAAEKEMTSKLKASEDEVADRVRLTAEAFGKQLEKQMYDSKVVKKSQPKPQTDFILYTPAQKGPLYNGGNQQRIIKMVEVQVDPMEPPKFQINKKIPRGPPSPPAAILSSPPRAPTKREKEMWKIPPCVSNWKNPRGYTVPLANRVAADGRNNQVVTTNDKINSFSEALFIAERKAREEIEQRNMLKQRIVQREKENKDEKLRQMANKVRERQGQVNREDDSIDARERDEIRHDRQRARNRERNLNRASADVQKKVFEDRDISEKIALGQANPLLNRQKDENIYDRRLMDKTGGLDSGYSGGADDMYNIYDKPLFNQNKSVYKAPRNMETTGLDDVDTYKSKKFLSEKEAREEPVIYEKEDPFDLTQFLTEVKQNKRPAEDDKSAAVSSSKRRK